MGKSTLRSSLRRCPVAEMASQNLLFWLGAAIVDRVGAARFRETVMRCG